MTEPEPQSISPPRKRRWLQFSLRTLLILVLLASIGMSWFAVRMRQAKRQREAVETIRAVRGTVWYGNDPKSLVPVWGTVWYVDDPKIVVPVWMTSTRTPSKEVPGPAWLRRWIGDDYFRYVVQVDLNYIPGKQLDNRDLESLVPHLANLPALETVCLDSPFIDDAGLAHLEEITSLKNLNINGFSLRAFGKNESDGTGIAGLWFRESSLKTRSSDYASSC